MTQKELQNAFNITETCITPCNRLHKVSENRVSFLLDRSKASDDVFWCIKVDACMIKSSETQKCDFAFTRHRKNKSNEFYFVELKNALIEKAYNQIVTTIKTHFKSPPKQACYAFIVANRVPSGTDIQNLRKKFMRDIGADLIVKSNTYTHTPQY
jgi:hypothetical protein